MLEVARARRFWARATPPRQCRRSRQVGGSKGTLCSHFPSKRDLFAAVVEELVQQMFAPLFEMAETQGDFRTALECFARRFLDWLLTEDSVAFYRVIVTESVRFPEIGHTAYQSGVQHGLDHLAGHFSAAMQRGELRRAKASVAATQFLDLCFGELHRKRLFGVVGADNRDAAGKQARNAVATFLAAYGVDNLSRSARA